MKRSLSLFAVVFFTLSLFLTFSAMAQKVTLESLTTGDRLGGAPIKTFSLAPDGSLIIYLNGPFNFKSILPDIVIASNSSCSVCTVAAPASVSAVQGTDIYFDVTSQTATSVKMAVSPDEGPTPATFTAPTFHWNTASQGTNPAVQIGSYLAVFEATDGTHTSQSVVMITINSPCQAKVSASILGSAAGGTLSPASQSGNCGGTVQFTGTVNANYTASVSDGSFQGGGTTLTGPANFTWNVTNGTTDKSVTITFTPVQQSCTATVSVASSGTGGSVTAPLTQNNIACGSSASFQVSISGGYRAQVSAGTSISTSVGPTATATWTVPVPAGTTSGSTINASISFSVFTTTACTSLGDSCLQQLASAVSLNFAECSNNLSRGYYGYQDPRTSNCNSAEYNLPVGETWFIVDSSQVSFTGSTLIIFVSDALAGVGPTLGNLSASVYPIDSNGNLSATTLNKRGTSPPIGIGLNNNQGGTSSFPASMRYLVRLTSTTGIPHLTIFYH